MAELAKDAGVGDLGSWLATAYPLFFHRKGVRSFYMDDSSAVRAAVNEGQPVKDASAPMLPR